MSEYAIRCIDMREETVLISARFGRVGPVGYERGDVRVSHFGATPRAHHGEQDANDQRLGARPVVTLGSEWQVIAGEAVARRT